MHNETHRTPKSGVGTPPLPVELEKAAPLFDGSKGCSKRLRRLEACVCVAFCYAGAAVPFHNFDPEAIRTSSVTADYLKILLMVAGLGRGINVLRLGAQLFGDGVV